LRRNRRKRILSDPARLERNDPQLPAEALDAVQGRFAAVA
jgi:hypothetical protein